MTPARQQVIQSKSYAIRNNDRKYWYDPPGVRISRRHYAAAKKRRPFDAVGWPHIERKENGRIDWSEEHRNLLKCIRLIYYGTYSGHRPNQYYTSTQDDFAIERTSRAIIRRNTNTNSIILLSYVPPGVRIWPHNTLNIKPDTLS